MCCELVYVNLCCVSVEMFLYRNSAAEAGLPQEGGTGLLFVCLPCWSKY